ncbi:MAG TPA: hypothetical protein VE780_02470 [Thermoleophilaceae bacterium]|nr:hypothetical protein [Thermoleophilaceae bacterium]
MTGTGVLGSVLAGLRGPPPDVFAGGAKPAGGAALDQVIGATAAAIILTGGLVAFGVAHRRGRTRGLRRLADRAAAVSGLPYWSALELGLASVSLLVALFGMYWDVSLHIDNGRDPGPLANPAHYFILAGLFGIFAAGFLAMVIAEERPSRSAVRVAGDWYAPIGGIVLMACSVFALLGFPLDDMWHRAFGQDVTLWGPTHLMMIGGAGLSLLGHATLLVEGRPVRRPGLRARPLSSSVVRVRQAAVFGGLLIGLSTFQGEFDFGVPQSQLYFQPVLIAVAAGIALVGARIYAGRGGALFAAVFFLLVRGMVSLLVGPVLGETTPRFPEYVLEAVLIELVALWVPPERTYRFGAFAGLLVGTVGLAGEWGWSHVWMPLPWPSSLLAEAAVAAPIAGVAAGLLGGFIGRALTAPRRLLGAPALAPAVAGLAAIVALVGFGLHTEAGGKVTASVTLSTVRPGPDREVAAAVRLRPPSAGRDGKWLTVTSWQGGGLVVDRLKSLGSGVYRTTQAIPVYGQWKATLRLHRGHSIDGIALYMPSDPAIPWAKPVPVRPRLTQRFESDRRLLQRERKPSVPAALPAIGYTVVGSIVAGLVLLLGWALLRLARLGGGAPRAMPPVGTGRARGREAVPAGR